MSSVRPFLQFVRQPAKALALRLRRPTPPVRVPSVRAPVQAPVEPSRARRQEQLPPADDGQIRKRPETQSDRAASFASIIIFIIINYYYYNYFLLYYYYYCRLYFLCVYVSVTVD